MYIALPFVDVENTAHNKSLEKCFSRDQPVEWSALDGAQTPPDLLAGTNWLWDKFQECMLYKKTAVNAK